MSSDLKDRVGVMTGGNANLIQNPGDLLTGDGDQCTYLRNPNVGGASDGLVLTLDSTADEGISWQPGGGGGGGITNVTGADGVTVSTPSLGVRQAHNDLVTGTPVANVAANTTGSANVSVTAGGGSVVVEALTGPVTIRTTGGGAGTVTVSGGTDVQVSAGRDMFFAPTRDETHTVGRNWGVTAAGSGGAGIETTHPTSGTIELDVNGGGSIHLLNESGDSGDSINLECSGSAELLFSTASGNAVATINGLLHLEALGDNIEMVSNIRMRCQATGGDFVIFDNVTTGAGRHGAIINAVGGAVIDAEARTALNTLLAAMRVWGWVTP